MKTFAAHIQKWISHRKADLLLYPMGDEMYLEALEDLRQNLPSLVRFEDGKWGWELTSTIYWHNVCLFARSEDPAEVITQRDLIVRSEVYQSVYERTRTLAGIRQKSILNYAGLCLNALDCLSLGLLMEARWCCLMLSRLGGDALYFMRINETPHLAILACVLERAHRVSPRELARLNTPKAQVYSGLAAAWEDESRFKDIIVQCIKYREKEMKKDTIQSVFGTGNSWEIPVEILAIYWLRRELRLPIPHINHPFITENPFFLLPDGPRAVPSDQVLDLARAKFDIDAIIREDIERLEALPDTLLGAEIPTVSAPSVQLDDTISDAELARLYMSPKSKDIQKAADVSAFEIRWKDSGVPALMMALEHVPDELYTIEESEDQMYADLVVFDRAGRLQLRRSKEVSLASIVPGQTLMAHLNTLLQPEYELCQLAASKGSADLVYLLKPKPWFDALRAADPKQFGKVFLTPKP
ncbi:MAG: hypothetical protein SF028_05680 [Candidatus Sumerlaeia bacterium]|nr:hypothetical protein [Candidatus Sumerlaeia bacterium]